MDFKKFFDKSNMCIFIIDNNNGNIIYVNEIFKIKTGLNNVINKRCKDIMTWCVKDYFNDINDKSIEIENIIKNKNGIIYNVLINATKIDDKIICFCSNITNITEYNKNMKLAYSELDESRRKAEMSDKLKSSFLANVSHEIRTPLNLIVGFSKLLNKASDEQKDNYVNIIEKNSNNLLNLIDDIIDLSKIEASEINIKSNKCFIYNILDELYNMYKYKVEDNIQFLKGGDLTNIIIYTDEQRLKQILNNLIINAIKFTHNGYIEIGYKLEQGVIIFYVKDTGIGIDEKDFDYIFERFTQLDEKDSKLYKGTGLGLSITKKLVELLGGKIWLKSKLGEGTTFYFTIPSDHVQKVANEYYNIDKYKKQKINWSDKKILIIEDDNYSSFLLIDILKKTNIEYDIVDNGLDSLKKINKNNYNLIISDIKLPDIHGYELVKKIKTIKNIPVISQTAFSLLDDKLEALEKGFDDYITKPIEQYKLIKTLSKYLN